MGEIVLLDDLTINKIAAGEVIERPASVIKEMVENSIDAGAKNITVEIKNGGISLIRITDDGKGIAEDDMEIAFERHATSKIRNAEDLMKVKTMGFRGEALASIAAISKVEMLSRTENEEIGHKIIVEGGKTIEMSEAGSPVGTKITVENLFYNTPVRYKFLKKDYTEAGYIEDALKKIALYNKEVAFKLISNGKTILQTNGSGDLETAVYSVFGKEISSELVNVDYEHNGMRVSGVVGKPVIARANRQNQLFYVNGRCIKDKTLSAAAEQAFKGIVTVGRYGFLILNIEMDPELVDVNVHPAKLEVRFQNEQDVFKLVYHGIKSSLMSSEFGVEIPEDDNIEVNIPKDDDENKDKNVDEEDELNKEESKEEKSFDSHDEIKKGFTSFFGKKKKDDFSENNHLEEIFKSRQEKKEKGEEIENPFEKKEVEEDGVDYSKEIKFGPNPMASDTQELNAQEVNDTLKEKKKEIIASMFGSKKDKFEEKDVAAVTDVVYSEEKLNKENDIVENITNAKINLEEINSFDDIKVNFDSSKAQSIIDRAKKHLENVENGIIDYSATFTSHSNGNDVDKVEEVKDDVVKTEKIDADEEEPEKIEEIEFKKVDGFGIDEDLKSKIISGNMVSKDEKEDDFVPVKFKSDEEEKKEEKVEEVEEKKGNTQEISTDEVNKRIEDFQKTISIDTIKKVEEERKVSEDTKVLTEELKQTLPEETVVLEENINDVLKANNENENSINTEDSSKELEEKEIAELEEDNKEDSDYNITENLIKAKMDLENTQMLNTDEVRKKLEETNFEATPEFEEMYKKTFGVDPINVRIEKEKQEAEKEKLNAIQDFDVVNMSVFEEGKENELTPINYKYVGLAFNTYVLIEIKDELYMIDRFAANERILYEILKQDYYTDHIDSQELLLPDVINVSDKEMDIAKENVELFNKAGFHFEEFGDNTLKLTAGQSICEELNTKQLFIDILDELDTAAANDMEEKEDKFLYVIANKIALEKRAQIDDQEIEELLTNYLSLPNPFEFTHGKPCAIKITRTDMEKKFNRR